MFPADFGLLSFHFHLFPSILNFLFDFFSDPLVIQKYIVYSPFVVVFVFFFLYLISNLIVLWSEKRLEMISFLVCFPKFTKAWFVAQDVIHPEVSSMCTWEKKWNLLFLDEISCRYWLGPSDPMYLLKLVFLKGLTALVGRSEVPKQQEEINCKW